ncbi:hypothetical protein ACFVTM_08875 [Arthrobacter sp. NPDC058130]|uniref:hypothetical protein n=1 Tax=Arthrobacter sp. NPDC058130 TaxID=3346353 RepID=UPI0036E6427A
MTTKPKDRSGALADPSIRVLAWCVGIVVLGMGAWLIFGQHGLSGASKVDRPTSASRPSVQASRPPVQASRPPVKHYADGYVPTDQEIEEADEESREKIFGKRWSCFYDPTMNENWHDDVRCTNGPKSYRPILLADQGFVTEEDMRAAGQDHENYLNSGGMP